MADFTPIYKSTLKWEGGYQNYASDKANYTRSGRLVGTNRGISAIAYEQYLGHEPSIEEIKAITPQIAEKVYRKLFWNKIKGDEIKDQDVASIIFAALIGNPLQSNKIVQAALAKLGKNISIKQPYTSEMVKAINRTNSKKLFYAIKEEKRKFLESLRTSKPEFIKGWMRKLESFTYTGKRKYITIAIASIIVAVGGLYAYKKMKG
jgi:lysozyme family protein